ncbi:MAG: hypothetical protein HY814_03275 [Candidatus Riflebacteria bacterium]|nr:hypothetical protein [Candidatus Riflebacteria bacterium]
MPRPASDNGGTQKPGPEETFLSALAYVPVLCLLPTMSRCESAFTRTHGRQGIVLFLAEVAASMLAFVPWVGGVVSVVLLATLVWTAYRSARIAAAGQLWRIPLIGDVAERLRALAP